MMIMLTFLLLLLSLSSSQPLSPNDLSTVAWTAFYDTGSECTGEIIEFIITETQIEEMGCSNIDKYCTPNDGSQFKSSFLGCYVDGGVEKWGVFCYDDLDCESSTPGYPIFQAPNPVMDYKRTNELGVCKEFPHQLYSFAHISHCEIEESPPDFRQFVTTDPHDIMRINAYRDPDWRNGVPECVDRTTEVFYRARSCLPMFFNGQNISILGVCLAPDKPPEHSYWEIRYFNSRDCDPATFNLEWTNLYIKDGCVEHPHLGANMSLMMVEECENRCGRYCDENERCEDNYCKPYKCKDGFYSLVPNLYDCTCEYSIVYSEHDPCFFGTNTSSLLHSDFVSLPSSVKYNPSNDVEGDKNNRRNTNTNTTNDDDDDDEIRYSVITRDLCINEYWGIRIDEKYQLFIFGEDIDNSYIFTSGGSWSTEIQIHLSFPSAISIIPFKVQCSHSSLFVLAQVTSAIDGNKTNRMFSMGRNEHHELAGGKIKPTFTVDEHLTDIWTIASSYHTLYVVHGNQSTGVHRISAIGENKHGEMAANSEALNSFFFSNTYADVYLHNFPVFDHLATPHYADSRLHDFETMLPPKIQAFYRGVVFSFGPRVHFYAGLDHPSTAQDEKIPVEIDFDSSVHSPEISNGDGINFIDRLIDGCLYIIAGDNRIYISGRAECGETVGMKSNPEFVTPQELSFVQYNEFLGNREMVYDFVCGHACYIVTQEFVYTFGRSKNGIAFAADCENDNCDLIYNASSSIERVVPGLGKSRIFDQMMENYYDVWFWEKSAVFNTVTDDEMYMYPPEIVFRDTSMISNNFTIHLRKKSVWYQLDPLIRFKERDIGNIHGTEACRVSEAAIDESKWVISHYFDDAGVGWDDYILVFPWEKFRVNCAFTRDYSNEEYDVYYNEIEFVEIFYRGVRFGSLQFQKERFFFNFEIRFPKSVLVTEISIRQDKFSGEYWDAYIVDKTFDRESRDGVIEFATVVKYPNFLVFIEEAIKALIGDQQYHHFPDAVFEYTQTSNIGDVHPNSPEYFIRESLEVYEVGTTSTPFGTSENRKRGFNCDQKNCFQRWMIKFKVIDDYRVCHVPFTQFPINWVSFCLMEEMSVEYTGDASSVLDIDHYDCVDPSQEITFDIGMEIQNLCGGKFMQTIETEFEMHVYSDWTYSEIVDTFNHVFSVGEWVYFKATVESNKVTITNVRVDEITWIRMNDLVSIPLCRYDQSTGECQTMPMGRATKFVIDELDENSDIGFHFKLTNDILRIQPGAEVTATIELSLAVMYEGNELEVISRRHIGETRRNSMKNGLTLVEKQMSLSIEYGEESRNDVVSMTLFILSIVGTPIVVSIFVTGLVVSCIVVVLEKKKKLYRKWGPSLIIGGSKKNPKERKM